MKKIKLGELPFIAKASGATKLLICLAISAIAFFIISVFKIDVGSKIIITWDAFSLSFILLCWALFIKTGAESLESVVIRQDEDHKITFLIILIAVCVSVFGTMAHLPDESGR